MDTEAKEAIAKFMFSLDQMKDQQIFYLADEVITDQDQYYRAVKDVRRFAESIFRSLDLPVIENKEVMVSIPISKLRTWSLKAFSASRTGHQCPATNVCKSIYDYLKNVKGIR